MGMITTWRTTGIACQPVLKAPTVRTVEESMLSLTTLAHPTRRVGWKLALTRALMPAMAFATILVVLITASLELTVRTAVLLVLTTSPGQTMMDGGMMMMTTGRSTMEIS